MSVALKKTSAPFYPKNTLSYATFNISAGIGPLEVDGVLIANEYEEIFLTLRPSGSKYDHFFNSFNKHEVSNTHQAGIVQRALDYQKILRPNTGFEAC